MGKIAQFFSTQVSSSGKNKVHLGCGSKYLDDWCNIDYYPCSDSESHRGTDVNPDVWLDISKDFGDEEVADIIYCSHVLEHFEYSETLKILKRAYDLLRPGGLFVVEMPDLQRVTLFYSFFGRKGPRALGNKFHSIISAQFYGASWEKIDGDFSLHKYVWEMKEFANCCAESGFLTQFTTHATISHVPARDFAYIGQKPRKNEFDQNIDVQLFFDYGSPFIRKIRSFVSFLKLSLKLLRPVGDN